MVPLAVVQAPGVIKLFGEHAVVYGRLSAAIAVSLYSSVSVDANDNEGKVHISLPDFSLETVFSDAELLDIASEYSARDSINAYVDNFKRRVDSRLLPYATIIGRYCADGGSIGPKRFEIRSMIPVQKGLASSAACSVALSVAAANLYEGSYTEGEVIERALDGDRIIHRNENAGRIDVPTSFYGGCISYSKGSGVRREELGAGMDIAIVDTGPKKSTAETVGIVSRLHENDTPYAERLFDSIDSCARRGIEAIRVGDFDAVGKEMYANHDALVRLGVSSDGLDRLVSCAKACGAYGAKLSGGGGGGMAIILCNEETCRCIRKEGFECTPVSVSLRGGAAFLKGRV